MTFYKLNIFMCEVTGKGNLDFFQALRSERNESTVLHARFPEQLKAAVLRVVQWRECHSRGNNRRRTSSRACRSSPEAARSRSRSPRSQLTRPYPLMSDTLFVWRSMRSALEQVLLRRSLDGRYYLHTTLLFFLEIVGRLDHLVEAVHDRFKDRYFKGESELLSLP